MQVTLAFHIIGWLITLSAFAWCIYEWGFRDDGPAYFAADWRRILTVAVFSIAGGLLVFFIMRLPERARYRVAVMVFGTIVFLAAAGCCWTAWKFFRIREVLLQTPSLWMAAAAQLGLCWLVGGLSILLWYRFRKSYAKKRRLAKE